MEQLDCVDTAVMPHDAWQDAQCAPAAFDPQALEPVMLNLEHAVRVQARPQFFGWTQGLLQNLLPHDLLVCALRNGSDTCYNVECFSSAPGHPTHFTELFRRDASILPGLVAAWE